ncbi:MAG: hypothetical protein ABI600_14715 [Luteolibacter sp.]
MNYKLNIPALIATTLAVSSVLSHATDDFTTGELALVFYSRETNQVSMAPEYYVFNLGASSSFRENTQNNVAVKSVNGSIASSNIAADLEAVFGATWAEDGLVRMMVVSTVEFVTNAPPTLGDPVRTFYMSRPRTSLNTSDKGFEGAAAIGSFSTSLRSQVSSSVVQFLGGANTAISSGTPMPTSGANVSGVRLTTSYFNSLATVIPNTTSTTYFKLGDDPGALLSSGVLPGTAGVEAAVDVFRVLNSTTGADLTSGSSSGNAVVGTGQFVGSITLDSAGNLKVQAVGIPTSSNYYSFATANNLTGGPTADTDKDGINNLTEYALNTNLSGSDGSVGTLSVGVLSFNKRADAVTNGDLTYAIEVSTDLGISNPWTTLTTGVTNDASTISAILPTGSPKQFGRLKIVSSAVAP